MKTIWLRILTAVIIALGIFGCNDDEPTSPSRQPLLVDKTWAPVSYTMGGQDITDEMDACETDNTVTFLGDGTFIQYYGDMKCDEFENDEEGIWSFKANETVLSLRLPGEPASDWTIVVLSENKLKISQFVQWINNEIIVTMEPI